MIIIYKNDGSIFSKSDSDYIQQGSNDVNKIFVGFVDNAHTTFSCVARFIRANDTETTQMGVTAPFTYNGYNYLGWVFNLTSEETKYAGNLKVFISFYDAFGGIQNTYITNLIINATGYPATGEPTAPITTAEFNSFMARIAAKQPLQGMTSVVVEQLPSSGVVGVLYFLKGSLTDKVYSQYIWNGSAFVWVGSLVLDAFATLEEQRAFEEELREEWQAYYLDLNNQWDAYKQQVDNKVNNALDMTPIPVATVNDLPPQGATQPYVVAEDGYWYYWNGSSWIQGQQYQAVTGYKTLPVGELNATLINEIVANAGSLCFVNIEGLGTDVTLKDGTVGNVIGKGYAWYESESGTIVLWLGGNMFVVNDYSPYEISNYLSAKDIPFDNSNSGLESTNVQGAIDELGNKFPVKSQNIDKQNVHLESFTVKENLENTQSFRTFDTNGWAICYKQVRNDGYVNLYINVRAIGNIKVFSSVKQNETFVVKDVVEQNITSTGEQVIKTKLRVSKNDYIGVAYSQNMAQWVYLTQAEGAGVYLGYTQKYNDVIDNAILTPDGANTTQTFAQDYEIESTFGGNGIGILTENYADKSITREKIKPNTISKNQIDIGYEVFQNYKYKETLESYLGTENVRTHANAIAIFRTGVINYTGYIKHSIWSLNDSICYLLTASKNGNTYTIKTSKLINLSAGYNEAFSQVEEGDYVGIYQSRNSCTWVYGIQITGDVYSFQSSATNVVLNPQPGDQFEPTDQTTLDFFWDFQVVSTNSGGGVDGTNINNNSIAKEKLTPELQNALDAVINNRPLLYINRRANISHLLRNATTTKKIVLVGDSITAGVGASDRYATSWAALFKAYMESEFNCLVVNNGNSGVDSSWVVQNLATLIPNDSDIVLCMIGTNNRATNNDLYSDMQTISQYCESRNIKFIPMCATPANNIDETTNLPRHFHMDRVNHILTAFAFDNDYELIDLYTQVYEYCDYDDTKLQDLLNDNLHPNDDGYYVMFRMICKGIGCAAKIKGAAW